MIPTTAPRYESLNAKYWQANEELHQVTWLLDAYMAQVG
jgi:hypothetical protein